VGRGGPLKVCTWARRQRPLLAQNGRRQVMRVNESVLVARVADPS
jgi:hypothetical protein